jgi:protein SCO1/2
MKGSSYIGISLIILIFGIIFIPKIIDRITNDDVVKNDRLNIGKGFTNSEKLSYIELYGENKKVPDFQFINQNGDSISNKDYLGKIYIIEFFFTTCPSICPIMNKNLVGVEKAVGDNKDFGIVSITIDPKHDTPAVLKQYAENYGVDNTNWNFLTGERDKIYELANKGFGIFANEDDSVAGGFAHSGMFALVDREGYIRSRLDKFGNPIIYYKGSIEEGKTVGEGEESSQIDILIEDIKKLL